MRSLRAACPPAVAFAPRAGTSPTARSRVSRSGPFVVVVAGAGRLRGRGNDRRSLILLYFLHFFALSASNLPALANLLTPSEPAPVALATYYINR